MAVKVVGATVFGDDGTIIREIPADRFVGSGLLPPAMIVLFVDERLDSGNVRRWLGFKHYLDMQESAIDVAPANSIPRLVT